MFIRICTVLLTVCLADHYANGYGCLNFYFRYGDQYDAPYCTYRGYFPSGQPPNIEPIIPPDVGAEIDTNDEITNGMTAELGISGTFLTLAGDVSSSLPYVGAVFISLSTLLGVFGGEPDPTVAMQNAMNELTGYINQQVSLLEDYTDQRVLDYHKEYLREQFIVLYTATTNCLEYNPKSAQDAIDCLEDVVTQQIDPNQVTFAQYMSKMSQSTDSYPTGLWTPWHDMVDERPYTYSVKFCKQYPARCPDAYTIKDFEASAATFGRYASLHLFVLTGIFYEYMTNTNIQNSTNTVIKILEDIRDAGYLYQDYASWLYRWAHIRQYTSSAGCFNRCPDPSDTSDTFCDVLNENPRMIEDCIPENVWCDSPLWIYESGKHTVNEQTCRATCNEFDNGYCDTNLMIRVDYKGSKWEADHSDVFHDYICDPYQENIEEHKNDQAVSFTEAQTIQHKLMFHSWCIDYTKSMQNSPVNGGVGPTTFLGNLKVDMQNWWTGHLLESAKSWGALADAVDQRLKNLGYPQDPWNKYPFPTWV